MHVVPFSNPSGPNVPQDMSSSSSFDFVAISSSSPTKPPTVAAYQPRSRPQRADMGPRRPASFSPRAASKCSFLAHAFLTSSMPALPSLPPRTSTAWSRKLMSFSLSVHFLRLSGFRFTLFSGGKSTVYLPFCSSKNCIKPTFPLSSGAESSPSARTHSFFSNPRGPVSNASNFQNSSFCSATCGSWALKCSAMPKNQPKSTSYREHVPPSRRCSMSPRSLSKLARSVDWARKSFMSFLACLHVDTARDRMFMTLSLSVNFFKHSGFKST
mmetsp:Transcript_117827/g.345176  ORF Transcript_117827/g.345176 Transcript_117827/m.345176 type:complete len:270 (+) Transcript_117827:958-1767(+)